MNENTAQREAHQVPVPVFQSAPGAEAAEQPEVTHATTAVPNPIFSAGS